MKKAIVAVEDKRYFEHSGVDVVSLLSVLKGGLARGGSTIPMQLLKNLVFHDLRAGDVITTWNGVRVQSAEEFVKTIRGTQPGTVNFEYTRDSKKVGAEARFNRREARRDSRR